jgi:hypothetical protein
VELVELEDPEGCDIGVLLRTGAAHPVAHASGPTVEVTLNATVTELLRGPAVPVTMTW